VTGGDGPTPDRAVIKQYGAPGTGTNLLRALLLGCTPPPLVLMHVLGDKHGPPVDVHALRARLAAGSRADDVVREATEAEPSATTEPDSPRQRAYVAGVADEVARAVTGERLCVTISARHPLDWAARTARRLGWPPASEGGRHREPAVCEALESACRDLSRRYRQWSQLHDRLAPRSAVVRYEDLVSRPQDTVQAVLATAGHIPARCCDTLPPLIRPGAWDDEEPQRHWLSYEPRAPAEEVLTTRMVEVVLTSTDWEVLTPLGYQRPDPPSASTP
jgi:hypothetical protein